jgi:prepilin-type N-terminal cleavage/methylation domain-containing protein
VSRVRPAQAGLTLVELMIAVLISSIAISAALTLGYSMMNSYRDNKASTLVGRSARISMEIISESLRNAVPGVPSNQIGDYVPPCSATPLGLEIVNAANAPDRLRVVYGAGGVVTSLAAPLAQADATMAVADATGFAPGDLVVVTDGMTAPSAAATTGALLLIDQVDVASAPPVITLIDRSDNVCAGSPWPGGGAGSFPIGAIVVRAKYAEFYIDDSAAVGGVPTLMAVTADVTADGQLDGGDAEPVAEGIEDMQVEVGYDVGYPQPVPTTGINDGAVFALGAAGNDDEVWYNNPGDTAAVPAGAVPRAVRLHLIARSVAEQSDLPTYTRPAAGDRGASSAVDQFRRRVMSTVIEIRNLQGSP